MRGDIEMRCTFDLLEKMGVQYNWVTLLVGQRLGLIEPSEVTRYAVNYISNNHEESDQLIIELAWNADAQLIEEKLQKLINIRYGLNLDNNSLHWMEEVRKWRYCMLSELRMEINDHKVLLEKVAEVYSDIGYPGDMENFIYYLPTKDGYDPAKHSKQENYERMIRKLDEFLLEEKLNLGSRKTDV